MRVDNQSRTTNNKNFEWGNTMAILKSKPAVENEKIKVEIPQDVAERIQSYLRYSGIESVSDFFTEASLYVFSKDKGFKAFEKQENS